jgi:hypothetical protein
MRYDLLLSLDAIIRRNGDSNRSSIKHLRNLRRLIPHVEEPIQDPFRSTENLPLSFNAHGAVVTFFRQALNATYNGPNDTEPFSP